MENQRFCNTVEAKAKLNELLDEVSLGGQVVIRRHGRAVAKLIGATEESLDDRTQTKQFLQRLRRFHQRVRKVHGQGAVMKSHTVDLLRKLRRES